jgi:GTP-binding protein HflX
MPLRSYFGGSLQADAMLHVVDLSHPAWLSQNSIGDRCIVEIADFTGSGKYIAFNKMDQVDGRSAHG